jgi:glycosyltransferase involved in cell wall biosynthesis
MSAYLISLERELDKRHPTAARLIRIMERVACKLPDLLFVDTAPFSRWFQDHYKIPDQKIRLIPLGADDRVFRPVERSLEPKPIFTCLYYGTFIPNHGVVFILESAKILSGDPTIQFELVGEGPDCAQMEVWAKQNGLNNVRFLGWLPPDKLRKQAENADVLLGTFSNTPQALMTMHNKIFEGLAMGLPVINGDSPVMRLTMEHGKHIYLCKRESASSLAEAILTLRKDPVLRDRLAIEGNKLYQDIFSFDHIGEQIAQVIGQITGNNLNV